MQHGPQSRRGLAAQQSFVDGRHQYRRLHTGLLEVLDGRPYACPHAVHLRPVAEHIDTGNRAVHEGTQELLSEGRVHGMRHGFRSHVGDDLDGQLMERQHVHIQQCQAFFDGEQPFHPTRELMGGNENGEWPEGIITLRAPDFVRQSAFEVGMEGRGDDSWHCGLQSSCPRRYTT